MDLSFSIFLRKLIQINNVSKTAFSAVIFKDRYKQKLGKADSKQQKGNGEEVINKPLTFLLPFTKMSSAF